MKACNSCTLLLLKLFTLLFFSSSFIPLTTAHSPSFANVRKSAYTQSSISLSSTYNLTLVLNLTSVSYFCGEQITSDGSLYIILMCTFNGDGFDYQLVGLGLGQEGNAKVVHSLPLFSQGDVFGNFTVMSMWNINLAKDESVLYAPVFGKAPQSNTRPYLLTLNLTSWVLSPQLIQMVNLIGEVTPLLYNPSGNFLFWTQLNTIFVFSIDKQTFKKSDNVSEGDIVNYSSDTKTKQAYFGAPIQSGEIVYHSFDLESMRVSKESVTFANSSCYCELVCTSGAKSFVSPICRYPATEQFTIGLIDFNNFTLVNKIESVSDDNEILNSVAASDDYVWWISENRATGSSHIWNVPISNFNENSVQLFSSPKISFGPDILVTPNNKAFVNSEISSVVYLDVVE